MTLDPQACSRPHTYFHRQGAELWCEKVPLSRIAQEVEGTTYVYSRAQIEANFKAYQSALADVPHQVC